MIALKVTTEYSLLKSLINIPKLIEFLKTHNIKTCGICDNELFGVMEFYLECKKNDIKPVIGLEVNINNNLLFLYPKNYEGYKKLLKINTKKFNNIELSDIENDNLFIVLPYESINLIDSFKNKENVYIGYKNNDEKKNSLLVTDNIIYFPTIRMFNKEDYKYLEYLKELGEDFSSSEEEYFKLNIVKEDEALLENFVSKINIEIPFDKRYIPIFKEGISSFEYLKKLSYLGLEKRLNGNINDVYKNRLDEELKVINDMGFVDYFLIVYDYVLYAKKNDILVGPGRGSAAGSLVSYSIGITDIDPIKYDLLFARFLNPYRAKMPDIDIDFEDTKRYKVIDYVKEKYGAENVAVGLTFNTYKAKLILRDLTKVLKIDSSLFEKFIKVIDASKSLEENKNEVVNKYLKLYPELNKLYDVALKLENLKKNISTHAAGVVICSSPLDAIIPIYLDDNILKTGITMDYLEKLGLLKMDFLALHNLSIIRNILDEVKNIDIKNINLNDEKTLNIFMTGNTNDIFQFESNYAKNSLLKLKISSFEELVIATAFIRPGPSNQIDEYIKNKNNKNYEIIPALREILMPTYGVIIFQEQVIKILEKIAKYSPYEADNIRNAMAKKKESIINAEEIKFIKRSIENGFEESFAKDLFNKIKRFAEYGFNKAHAVSYALISYELAYLKANYPLEFNVSILKNTKDKIKQKRLLSEIKKENIKILKPNINKSNMEFQYKDKYLLLPFTMVRNLNNTLIEEILSKRESGFKDIYDFFIKCQSVLNDKNYNILVRSGVLDTFKINHQTLINNYEVLMNYASLNDESLDKPILNNYEEYDITELRKDEIDMYGFYVGNHPCSIYQNVIKVNKTKDYLFKNINMVVLVEKITKIKTKNGDEMSFINVSDETGMCEVTVFPDVLKKCPDIKSNDIIKLFGKSSRRYDEYQIIAINIRGVENE